MLELLLVLLAVGPTSEPSASLAGAPATRAAQDAWSWERLPLPDACRVAGESTGPAPLADGRHIRLEPDGRGDARASGTASDLPHLPTAVLADLLSEDARNASGGSRGATRPDLRVLLPAPPLIVGGTPQALARARAICADLDEQVRRARIRLEVWLTPAVEHPGGAVLAPGADLPAGAPLWTGETSAGAHLQFGRRLEHAFLSTFQAEVASGSEIADPVFGTALSGRTLHLRAWRVEGGEALLVEGFLDLAHLAALETVDTGSPDLGELQRPLVDSVQVGFAGRVVSGGALRVTLEGSPLPEPDWTLVVRAATAPDAVAAPGVPEVPEVQDGGGDGDAPTWRMVDVGLLEEPVRAALPGALGAPAEGARGARPVAPVLLEALGAHALAGQLLGTGSGASVPPLHLTAGAILAPRSAQAFWDDAAALIRAAEGARSATALLTVERGGLRVGLPVAGGSPCRVQVGRESTRLVDYDPQIAPDSWLAAPRVLAGFEGLDLHGNWIDDSFLGGWSAARDLPAVRLERRATTHGLVELTARVVRGDRLRVAAGQTLELAPAEGDEPRTALRVLRP